MQMRSAKGEIKCYVDDTEKFERDLGLIVESEPDVEQVREPDVEQVRSLDEYCQTYSNGYYTAVGTIERGIKAVLDLAGVKYREGSDADGFRLKGEMK
jgi:hypothetical protein